MSETFSMVFFGMVMMIGGIGIGLLIAAFILEKEEARRS
jgi:hypothetical protein